MACSDMMQSSLSALCQAGVACPSNCSQSEWVLQHAYAFGNAGWAVAGLLLGSACQGRESCILSSACPALSVYGAHQVTMLHGMHSSTPACFACWVVNVASCLLPGKLLKPSMLCIDHGWSLLQGMRCGAAATSVHVPGRGQWRAGILRCKLQAAQLTPAPCPIIFHLLRPAWVARPTVRCGTVSASLPTVTFSCRARTSHCTLALHAIGFQQTAVTCCLSLQTSKHSKLLGPSHGVPPG